MAYDTEPVWIALPITNQMSPTNMAYFLESLSARNPACAAPSSAPSCNIAVINPFQNPAEEFRFASILANASLKRPMVNVIDTTPWS